MIPIKTEINESISLMSINTDKFKTSMLAMYLVTPPTKEATPYTLLLSGILDKGSDKFSSMSDFNHRLDELYAAAVEIKPSSAGKNNILLFSAEMLDNAFVSDGTDILDGVLEVMSQMLLHPISENNAFQKEIFERERSNTNDMIKSLINNPKAYALARCSELMNKDNADFFSIERLLASIKDSDETTLYRYYKNMLENSHLNFFYIGSEESRTVSNAIAHHFSEFSSSPASLIPIEADCFTEFKESTEDMPLNQGKLCMGFRCGVTIKDNDFFCATLLNSVFGASPSSKLFMNVREKLGLCYYCSSSYNPYFGNITVSSGINVSDFDAAKDEILQQLKDIGDGKITDEELSAAKKALFHSLRQMQDYPFELFEFYGMRDLISLSTSPEEYIRRLDSVNVKQISELAKKIKLDTVYFLKGSLSYSCETEDCEE